MIEDKGYINGIAQTERITELSEDQEKALEYIDDFMKSKRKYMVIGGIAGSGKSSIIPFIREKYKFHSSVAAFTGKATMVLKRKGIVDAVTLHSLLYYLSKIKDEKGNEYFVWKEKPNPEFRDTDLVIVDEASMVNKEMFDILNRKNFKVIYIGDHFQLPPVKDDFNIMLHPDFKMEKILRQNEDNPIVHLAEMARNNQMIPLGNYGDSKCTLKLNKEDMINYNEIIVWTNQTKNYFNELIRGQLNYNKDIPCIDEKMIVKMNNRPKNLFNGQIVYLMTDPKLNKDGSWKVEMIDELAHNDPFIMAQTNDTIKGDAWIHLSREEMEKKAGKFSDIHIKNKMSKGSNLVLSEIKTKNYLYLDYGYAITCHNAQGSSWENIAVINEKKMFHYKDYYRWLYTAITRAEKSVTIYRY